LWEHLQQTITPVIAAVATLVLLFTVLLMGAVLLLRRTDAEAA
jgi:ABC-type spermidine/putrescine transport system permease subunit II